jgi:hypothetical protein
MKPLFTIHAGEYLVASHIEQHFKRVNVWIPSRDTGVDLLVSDSRSQRTVSLQVKFSKDFLYGMKPIFQDKDSQLRACGWWTINREKLKRSVADFWVFMLLGFNGRTKDFVLIPPEDLLKQLESVHGSPKIFQTYLWVTTNKRCFETRDLPPQDSLEVARGRYEDQSRDLSQWLNNWTPVRQLNE